MTSHLCVPEWIKTVFRPTRNFLYGFGRARVCPVCGRHSFRFKPYGLVPRKEARCVHCEALERHRLVWLFMQKKTNLFDGQPKNMLHIAPEDCLASRLKKRISGTGGGGHAVGYLSADLCAPNAMVKMDITDIQFPPETFDVVYCSHVLEHVPDDRKAMREFWRVLKPGGWAILNVPVIGKETFEDFSITDPDERERVFGQDDHVRLYGPDYADRLREAGFVVTVVSPGDMCSATEIRRFGLTPAAGDVYFCTKEKTI